MGGKPGAKSDRVPLSRFEVLRSSKFDEVLDSESYGECRGSGVLRRIDGNWRIVQYNLTIPLPNEIAAEVVERIRTLQDGD